MLHFLNNEKRMSFLKVLVEHVSNKEIKLRICCEFFKRLNNDLINVFVRKIKFDRCKSFKAKVSSLRIIIISSSLNSRLTSRDFTFLLRDVASFINHHFLNIRLKRLKNDLFENSSIKEFISKSIARDFRYSINQNFLSLRLKRLENNLFTIYSIKTTFVQEKLFIFQ